MGVANDSEGQIRITALRQGLRQLGWTDGVNVQIDADIDQIRSDVAELVASKPDVIVVNSIRVLNATRQATREIPIVFLATSDPVGQGIVESLAHPGGNLTGFMRYEVSVAGKLAELLKEMVPHLTRVAFLFNPDNLSAEGYWRAIQSVAVSVGMVPVRLPVRDAASIRDAVDTFARTSNSGLVLPSDVTTIVYRDLIVALAAQHRLPAAYSYREVVASGGLMSYGPDTADLFQRAASYVDRVLKGEKPGDLPVQAPTKFEFAINLNTAKAIGIEVPSSILLRATEVIE